MLIPVGVLEYHGPQNPLGTDALICQGIIHPVAELRSGVFGRISVVSDSEFSSVGYGGHGGRDETAAMMYLCPGTVDLDERKKETPAWAADATEATAELGEKFAKTIVASWVKELGKGTH